MMTRNNMTQNKIQFQKELLENRIAKNLKNLRKWARKNRITCYRIYDKDIPEIPLAIDIYSFLPDHIDDKLSLAKFIGMVNDAVSANSKEGLEFIEQEKKRTYIHMYLYERPYEKNAEEEDQWLLEMKKTIAKVTGIDEERVIIKHRRKQTDGEKRSQYEKIASEKTIRGLVQEQGQFFIVNLSDYIDTGLFFDHRPLRKIVREESAGKRVLNLFCYTGSVSVYAAEGNASFVESVDLSNTYIDWARTNMSRNGFDSKDKYKYTTNDVFEFLEIKSKSTNENNVEKYDLIVLDPPTFSNSKKTRNTLNINRDWPKLVELCASILNPKGTLYFSTNSRELKFEEEKIPAGFSCTDISQKTIPEDYRNQKIHRVWKIVRTE